MSTPAEAHDAVDMSGIPTPPRSRTGSVTGSSGVPIGSVATPSNAAQTPAKNSKVQPQLRVKQLQLEAKGDKQPGTPMSSVQSPQLTGKSHHRHVSEFKVDCGTSKFKHLSLEKVAVEMNKHHPRRRVRGDKGHMYLKHPAWASSTGRHKLCGHSSLSDFTKYGLGIDLYFKFMKAMATLLFFMMLASLPIMMFYHAGGALSDDVGTSTSALSLLSLGNLGAGSPVCASAYNTSSVLSLKCESGTVIGQVNAFYGDITGECLCPAAQAPNPDCSGKPIGNLCSPNGTYCHKSTNRPIALPTGQVVASGAPCCSSHLAYGEPDFSELDFRQESSCASTTAAAIVRGRCIGMASCDISPDADFLSKWIPNSSSGTDCDQLKKVNGVCQDSFNSDGALNTCTSERRWRLVVTATCYYTNIAVGPFDTVMAKRDMALYICYIDIVAILVYLGVTYWIRIKEEDERTLRKSITAANYTVMVTNLPRGRPQYELEEMLRAHFEGLLSSAPSITQDFERIRVADVNFGVNNSVLVSKLKKRGKLVKELELALKRKQFAQKTSARDLNAVLNQAESEQAVPSKVQARVTKLEEKIERYDKEIDTFLEGNLKFYAVVAFVTFEEEEGALRALEQYPDSTLYRFFMPLHKKVAGHKIRVRPAPEPSDILWENLETRSLNRLLRSAFTLICTACFLGTSALLVYLANNKRRELQQTTETVNCAGLADIANKTLVMREQLWEYYNLTSGNTGRLYCYCKHKLYSSDPTAVFRDTFLNPVTGLEERWCTDWLTSYLQFQTLLYTTTAVIVGVNLFFRMLLGPVVKFEHNWSKTGEILSRATKQFFLQFCNTALLMLFLQAQFTQSSGVFQQGQYRDFTVEWYQNVGVSTTITMMAFTMSPHIGPLMNMLKASIVRCWDRGCTFDKSRTRKITQQELENMHIGPNLFLDERYAQMLAAIYFSLTYSTGIPLLVPILFLFFVILYWVDKFLFCNVYRTPPQYSWHLANRAGMLLPFAGLFHLAFGAWMLSNQDIIPPSDLLSTTALGFSSSAGGKISSAISWLNVLDPTHVGISTRMQSTHVFPMFVALVFLLFILVISRLFWSQLMSCWNFLRPTSKASHAGAPNYFDALPNDVLESGLYDGNVKSSLIMPYMEAVQRRMLKKGWTKEQLLAIQRSFDAGLQREAIMTKHPEILEKKQHSGEQMQMMANVAIVNAVNTQNRVPMEHQNSLGSYSTSSEDDYDEDSPSESEDSLGGSESSQDELPDEVHDSEPPLDLGEVNVGVSRGGKSTNNRRRKLWHKKRAHLVPLPDINADGVIEGKGTGLNVDGNPSSPRHVLAGGKVTPRRANTAQPTVGAHSTISGSTTTTASDSTTSGVEGDSRPVSTLASSVAASVGEGIKSPRRYNTDEPARALHRPKSNKEVSISVQRRKLFRQTLTSARGESMRNVMQGLHTYDLHANYDYRRAFALDAIVPDNFLRGLPGYEISVELPENALEETLNRTLAATNESGAQKTVNNDMDNDEDEGKPAARSPALPAAQFTPRVPKSSPLSQPSPASRQNPMLMEGGGTPHSAGSASPSQFMRKRAPAATTPQGSSQPTSLYAHHPRRASRLHHAVTVTETDVSGAPITSPLSSAHRRRPEHTSPAVMSPPAYQPEAT